MSQVFISYSRKDLPFVEQLVTDLRNAGLDVWYDVSNISGGSRWRIEIETAIRSSQFVIVVVSPDSMSSEWVEREFLFASNLKRKIIPLIYHSCELPLNYLDLNYIDIQGEKYQQEFPNLLHALTIDPKTVALPNIKIKKSLFALRTEYIIAIIGAAATIFAALLGSPLLINAFEKEPVPTLPLASATSSSPKSILINTEAPARHDWSEIISARTPTLNEIREDMLSIWDANNLSLGDMASPEIRSFSGTAKSNSEYLWPIFWCAIDSAALDLNVKNIDTVFTVNNEQIPDEDIFDYDYDTPNGWKCNYHATVIGNFPKDKQINLQVTRTFKTDIFDGEATYPAGIYAYKLVISVK